MNVFILKSLSHNCIPDFMFQGILYISHIITIIFPNFETKFQANIHKPFSDAYNCVCYIFENKNIFALAVNPCGLEPCKNGAKCSNDKDTFKCTCTAGFMGRTCVERKYIV